MWLLHGYSPESSTVASICDVNILNMNQYQLSWHILVFLFSSSQMLACQE